MRKRRDLVLEEHADVDASGEPHLGQQGLACLPDRSLPGQDRAMGVEIAHDGHQVDVGEKDRVAGVLDETLLARGE